MTGPSSKPRNEAAVSDVLRRAVQNVMRAGNSPAAIRSSLGLDDSGDLLHVQNASVHVQIDSPDGTAYFIRESGPSWVQYRDHRPHAEWQNVTLPVEFDPDLPVNVDVPAERGGGR